MISKVQELLFRADFFLTGYCKLKLLYDRGCPKDSNGENEFAHQPICELSRLIAYLYYSEALSCTASLLRKKQKNEDKDEISFTLLIDQLDDSRKNKYDGQLKGIYSKYTEAKLDKIRNKIIDHKDASKSGDPATPFINFINPIYVDPLQQILDMLKKLSIDFFPGIIKSNNFESLYIDARSELEQIVYLKIQDIAQKTCE